MFLDLSGVHATRWCSVVYPKNVLGPIAASTSVLDALNRPKKCSWTHLAVALHPHQTVPSLKNVPGPIRESLRSLGPQTMHTGIMFADLSGIHSRPLIEPW